MKKDSLKLKARNKVLIDEQIPEHFSLFLRKHLNTKTAKDLGLNQTDDHEVFQHARSLGRILLTRDKGFYRYRFQLKNHPGIILLDSFTDETKKKRRPISKKHAEFFSRRIMGSFI